MKDKIVFSQGFEIQGGDFVRAGEASCQIVEALRELAFRPEVVRRAGIAAYEAEMNMVLYAERGTLAMTVTPDAIMIFADDQGQGIPDIELAMQDGYSTATQEIREMGFGAGMGLSNIKKNSDEMHITSTVGEGTKVHIVIEANGARSNS